MAQSDLFGKDHMVVKANDLVKAKSNFTRMEHRIIAMMIARLKKSDQEFKLQRIYIKDLQELAGTNYDAIYERMEDICDKLLDQQIKVRKRTDNDKRVYQGYNILDSCRYVEGSGYIEAMFTKSMKPFLLQLKERFTMYQLQHFMKLTSSHSMRIYEILKMRADLEHITMAVEELREVLGCEDSYSRFSDFKRYVLEKAQEELHEKTDLAFRFHVHRKGRTPTHVRFRILRVKEAEEEAARLAANGETSRTAASESDASNDSPSTPAGPKIGIQGMLLDELSQDELERFTLMDIQRAIEKGEAHAREQHPNASSVNQSIAAFKVARDHLRSLSNQAA